MLSRAEAKLLQELERHAVREREGLFLAEGVRVVEELLASPLDTRFAAVSSSLEDTARGARLRERLHGLGLLRRLGPGELRRLSATKSSQGVIAVAGIPRRRLDEVRPEGMGTFLLLDAVQDPGNVGTLVRTADALGVREVLRLPGTVDAWNPKVVRAAAGSLFRLPPIDVELGEAAAWLRERGCALLGADAAGESIERVALPGCVALAVGNEGAGLSDGVRAAADGLVAVPTPGLADSLNVAAAAAILLYQITRSRAHP
jgi:RNA methyltransferase, TrmH family